MPKKKSTSTSKKTGSNVVARKEQNNDSYDISDRAGANQIIFQKSFQFIVEGSPDEIRLSISLSKRIFRHILGWVRSLLTRGPA